MTAMGLPRYRFKPWAGSAVREERIGWLLTLLAAVLVGAALVAGCGDDIPAAPVDDESVAQTAPIAETADPPLVEQEQTEPAEQTQAEPEQQPEPAVDETDAALAALREWAASVSTIRYSGRFSIRTGTSTNSGRSDVVWDLVEDRFWVQVESPDITGAAGRELVAHFLDVEGEPYIVMTSDDGSEPQWFALDDLELDESGRAFLDFVARMSGQNHALGAAWLEQRMTCAADGLGRLSVGEEESGPVWRLGCRVEVEDDGAIDDPAEQFAVALIEEFIGAEQTLRTLLADESGLPDGDPDSPAGLVITAALTVAISRDSGAPLSVAISIEAAEHETNLNISAVFTLIEINRAITFPTPTP